MAKKKTVLQRLEAIERFLFDELGYQDSDPAQLSPAEPPAIDKAPLNPAELQSVKPSEKSAQPRPVFLGDKGGTTLTPLPTLPAFADLKSTNDRNVVNDVPGTQCRELCDHHGSNWAGIVRVLNTYTTNILATKKGLSREARHAIAVKYILKHGSAILPWPSDRQRSWIVGAALFAHRNPSTIANPLKYMLGAVESARTGGEPCPDEYFRDAEALFLDEKAPRPPVRGSIGDILKGQPK